MRTQIGILGNFAGTAAGATASSNIYISNPGAVSDHGVIRIGAPTSQMSAYIAGINGAATTSGVPVFVDSPGKLDTSGGGFSFSQLNGMLTSTQFSGT